MANQPSGNPNRPSGLKILIRGLAAGWAIACTSGAWAQASNPYGRIDSGDASVEALRLSVGAAGSPATLEVFSSFDPHDRELLLRSLLDHQAATMRVIAARELVETGSDPGAVLRSLPESEERNALVIGLFGEGLLTPESASEILAVAPDLGVTPRAILSTLTGDREGLAKIVETPDAPELARGVAAAATEDRAPGGLGDWLARARSEGGYTESQFDRIVFEVLATARRLELVEAIRVMADWSEDRPADDALRAAAVLALLELDSEQGLPHWRRLFEESRSSRQIAAGLLLVTAGVEAPDGLQPESATGDALQTAIWRLIQAAPETRGSVASEVVARGHGTTTQWLLSRPDIDVPTDSLLVVLDHVLEDRRAQRVASGIEAATQVARVDPAAVAMRVRRALDARDPIGASIGLRGLVAAGTPEAAELASAFKDAPQRSVKSLALLAMARGGTLDDEALIRQLGRAAAGGGELPNDLRPLAAWYYLRSTDRLPADIPRILDS